MIKTISGSAPCVVATAVDDDVAGDTAGVPKPGQTEPGESGIDVAVRLRVAGNTSAMAAMEIWIPPAHSMVGPAPMHAAVGPAVASPIGWGQHRPSRGHQPSSPLVS